jgi:hypothetical protein
MKCPKGINPAPQVTAARNIRGNVIANGLSCGWQGAASKFLSEWELARDGSLPQKIP